MRIRAKSRLVISSAALILLAQIQCAFAACAAIDDMENYTPWAVPVPQIYQIWVDGLGDCLAGSGNGTGCNVVEYYDFSAGGSVSMKYEYDNDGVVYSPCTLDIGTREHKWSVARAELTNLYSEFTSDWTAPDFHVLTLAFYGQSDNDIEEMWIRIEDSTGSSATVYYGENPGEDPNNMAVELWHIWAIELSRFAQQVDLANVHAISIGVGQEGSTVDGGSGTLYIDDIGLCPRGNGTIYVNSTAPGSNTGANWNDAFTSLSDALDAAIIGDRIFVAEGTYHPAVDPGATEPRQSKFRMSLGVGIYGGFPTEGDPNLQHRDPIKHRTILSGDIGIPGDPNDNCYHVVNAGDGSAGFLDGFTITGGNANGQFGDSRGGGIYTGSGSPIVANCTFTGNIAGCGGAIANHIGRPVFVNCTFSGNDAPCGNVIYNHYGKPRIVNCILWGSPGAPISNYKYGSVKVTYSHVEGGRSGEGNTSGDPLFVRNPSDGGDGWGVGGNDDLGDLRLQPQSPCIDAGSNAWFFEEAAHLAGLRNVLDGDCTGVATVDMGAHEFNFATLGDIAADCDVDTEDYALLAARWKETPCNKANSFCGLADIDRKNGVNFGDVLTLARNWLASSD